MYIVRKKILISHSSHNGGKNIRLIFMSYILYKKQQPSRGFRIARNKNPRTMPGNKKWAEVAGNMEGVDMPGKGKGRIHTQLRDGEICMQIERRTHRHGDRAKRNK